MSVYNIATREMQGNVMDMEEQQANTPSCPHWWTFFFFAIPWMPVSESHADI